MEITSDISDLVIDQDQAYPIDARSKFEKGYIFI